MTVQSAQKTPNSGYYDTVSIQLSAKEGPQDYQVDGKLAQLVKDRLSGQGDGRISKQDAKDIATAIRDGGVYAEAERAIVKALFRARDDRFSVEIDGQKIRLTDPAEAAFTHEMLSFWGSLGAKAAQVQSELEDCTAGVQGAAQTVQNAVQQFEQMA